MAFTLKKRRKTPRAPLNRPVQLILVGSRLIAHGAEVSPGGMLVWINQALNKGQMLTVSFFLPNHPVQMTAMAEVVWVQPPLTGNITSRIGLRFVALPCEEREVVRAYVNHQAKSYRDLHILLAMDQWQLEQVQALTQQANIGSYRDAQELRQRVRKAMDGFRL